MTDIQFNHQENQINFTASAEKKTDQVNLPLAPKPQKSLRFVPLAILASFVFIGGLISYKIYLRNQDRTPILIADQIQNTDSSTSATISPGSITRETAIQPQDQIVINPQEETVKATSSLPVPEKPPVTPTTIIAEASPPPTTTNRSVITEATTQTTTKGGIITKTPPPTRATPKAIASPTPVVTISKTQTPPPNTRIVKTTYVIDDHYKPNTPYLETCGTFEDGRWKQAKIVLPKFDKNNETAQEYWVQVGKSYNANDIYDHRYQQADRVVFELNLDNHQEYFVRFAIKINSGEFQKWSNTLNFKCERS